MGHTTHTQSSAVRDIQTLPLESIMEEYEIQVDENGSVWDKIEEMEFKDLKEWAAYIDELNNNDCDSFSKIGSKPMFDDEY